MPEFAASLTKTYTDENGDEGSRDDLALSSDGTIITITEHSNYPASDESGHLQAAFSLKRTLIVTDDNGNDYVYSSVSGEETDEDGVIDPGSAGNLEVEFTPQAGDSVYQARLITIPTWSSGATYQSLEDYVVKEVDDVVKIYKSIQTGSNKDPETQTAYWTEVEDQTTLPDKYNIVGYIAVVRSIMIAKDQAEVSAAELFISQTFASPTGNKWWVKATTLDMIIKAVIVNVKQALWDKVRWLIANGKQKSQETP